MAVINFPTNPINGYVHSANGSSWLWNGSYWNAINGGPQGTQGLQGTQGTQGVQGTLGTQGVQGLIGQVSADPTTTVLLYGGM